MFNRLSSFFRKATTLDTGHLMNMHQMSLADGVLMPTEETLLRKIAGEKNIFTHVGKFEAELY
jgi:hypothetical protein